MVRKAASKNAKKKGPKGKKARRKAKLNRQWGEEEIDDDIRQKKRVGKSRLMKAGTIDERRGHVSVETPRQHNDDEDSSSDEEDIRGGGSIETFITNLARVKGSSSMMLDEDAENVSNYDDLEANDDSEESDDEGENAFTDEANNQLENLVDPFAHHFSAPTSPPLPSKSIVTVPSPSLSTALGIDMSECLVKYLSRYGSIEKASWKAVAQPFFRSTQGMLQEQCKDWNQTVTQQNSEALTRKAPKQLPLSSLQTVLLPVMWTYADMLVTCQTLEVRTSATVPKNQHTTRTNPTQIFSNVKNRPAMENLVMMHIVNHVLTTQQLKRAHNKRLKKSEDIRDGDDEKEEDGMDMDRQDSFRDQGFTKTTVLVLLPTRGVCLQVLRQFMSLLGDEATIENQDRLESEYGIPPEEDADTPAAKRRAQVQQNKGTAWNELFGDDVNTDDDFKIGVSILSKRTRDCPTGLGIRLYSDFYKSDMIFASPLALKMAGETDRDFLSSIEICVVGRADVLLMQNWDHVNDVLDMINQQPKRTNETDFSRVRNYMLEGNASRWRQLIVLSAFSDPLINSAFKRHAKSHEGFLKLRRKTLASEAAMNSALIQTKQVFQRIRCDAYRQQGEAKVKFFADQVLPQLLRKKQKHTMVFIPSYFDFVSIRNVLLKRDCNFASISEYSRGTEVSRGRARFLQGRKDLLLYTGRAHYFSRHFIKGCRHVIFVGLPEHAEFYSAIASMLSENQADEIESPTSCLCLFTKFDAHALERVVGKKTCDHMLRGDKSSFMFLS